MSGLGLRRLGRMRAARVRRVELVNARRGFAKPSLHGDRYAMVLEAADSERMIGAAPLAPDAPGEAAQGILLDLDLDDLMRISAREGYSPDAFLRLATLAEADALSVPAFLFHLMREAGGDIAAYRRLLRQRVDYTSAHYVPHPIALTDNSPALTFVAPGREGSGDPAVVPVRVATEHCDVLDLRETWRLKPNRSQLEYFAMCLLASAHGVRVDDIAAPLDGDTELRQRVRDFAAGHAAAEVDRFRAALDLSHSAYATFAAPARHLYSRLFTA